MAKDFYDTLGMSKGATEAELKRAYRKLARKHHPDVNPGDKTAEVRFKEVQHAYDVLSDAEQRKVYDQVGHAAYEAGYRNGGPGPGGSGGAGFAGTDPGVGADFFRQRGGSPGYTYTWTGGPGGGGGERFTGRDAGEVNDLFEQLFNQGYGGAQSWQGSPFGSQARQRVRARGADKQHAVSISFADAYNGKELTLRSRDGKTLRARIPAGIDTGGKVRLVGQGEEGLSGGPPGDLLLHVTVQDHPYFERQGDNIYLTAPITITEAALGATIEVPTMSGRVQMKVPPGTQSGRELRLRDKGFPHLGGAGRGDQLVRIQIVVPESLDMRSRELLREFEELNPSNPRLGRWE